MICIKYNVRQYSQKHSINFIKFFPCRPGCASSQYTIQQFSLHRCTIHGLIMQTCLLYVEIIHNITGRKNITVICKDLVFWVKKTSLIKEAAFF